MRNKGFSLIEILLAISIISGISMIGFLGLSRVNQGRDLGDSYTGLMNNLNEAKASAVAQIIPTTVTNCPTSGVVGYSINVYPSYYITDIICVDASGNQSARKVKKITLPSGMVMTTNVPVIPATGGGPLIRRIIFQTDGTSTTSGQVCLSKNGAFRVIDINENGVISPGSDESECP